MYNKTTVLITQSCSYVQ